MLSDSGTAAAAGIPGFNAGSAAVRAAAIAGAQAAGEMATTTKAKDELRLEYKLQTLDGTVVLPARTEVKKATEDGQDLLTPLVEHAAEAVSAATTKP